MRHPGRADDSLSDQKNPVFPKMHVNDTERVGGGSGGGGGAKPPPRNKMAIYDYDHQPAAAAGSDVNASTSQRIFTYTTALLPTPLPLPPPPPQPPLLPPPHEYSGISSSGSSICYVGGHVAPPASAAAVRFPFYARNATMANTSTLPTLPILLPPPPPFSKLHDGRRPAVSSISQEKKPPQVSSGSNVEKIHPELEIIFHRSRECFADDLAELHSTPVNPITSTTNRLLLKQSNRTSKVFASCSSTKHANNSTEESGASDLNRRDDSRLPTPTPTPTHVDDIRGNVVGYATSNHKPHTHCEYKGDIHRGDPEWHNVSNVKGSHHLEITPAESSCIVITPEEAAVSAIIGEEAFLRMRSEMIKHQKQFVEQVFELHRLITVQRLIARSRWTLFGDNYKLLERPSSSRRRMNPKEAQKGHGVERQDDTFRLVSSSGCINDMFYPPPQKKDTFKVPPITPRTIQETFTGNPKPANGSGMNSHWNYPPTGTANHWLVPIMSPSEGLIYKPYPIPSTTSPAGYMPPPVHINPPKLIQTHPPPCQPSDMRTLPDIPFCFPPLVTSPAFEHIGKVSDSYHHPKATLPGSSFKNSWNFSTLGSGTVSCQVDAANQAKHGGDSTASSSPPESTQGNILPLFPEEPTPMAMLNKPQHRHQKNQRSEQQQQRKVIKVVPRPPTSATESTALIIRSIMEERR